MPKKVHSYFRLVARDRRGQQQSSTVSQAKKNSTTVIYVNKISNNYEIN